MPPVVLAVSLKDDASAGLRSLHAEIGKLGGSASSAAPGLNTLGTATHALHTRTLDGTGSIQGWKNSQLEAAKAATASIPKMAALGSSTEKAHGSFFSSTKSALAFGTAVTGMQIGLNAVGNAVQAVVGHVVGFESAMANVNTLGNNSIEVQARLRAELLKLPSALGDSITLAKGLYDVLSAGVAPSESVQFLATSATLAKAGLADLGVTTEALTKSMAAFKISTELADQVSDVFFKTVDLGQGNLQAFARAMPTVTQVSASLGISFVDTTSAMATLTQTFRNADTAATGYRSLLTQLIQSSDKFASQGVNITKVLSEQGLAGALRVLQDLTGGNSEKMKFYVNDVEAVAAATALTGPQFSLFLANLDKTRNSLGTVSKGFKIQQQTASEAWKAMTAEAGKTADQVASPFLRAFVAIAQGATSYVAAVNRSLAGIQAPATGMDMAATHATTAAMKAQAEQLKTTSGVWASLGNIMNIVALAQSHEQTVTQKSIAIEFAFADATARTADALNFGGTAADQAGMSLTQLNEQLITNAGTSTASGKATQQLRNDLEGLALTASNFKPGALKLIDPEDAARSIDAAIAQFGRIETSGKVSFTAILAQAKSMLDGIRDQMGASSPATLAFAAMVEGMEAKGRTELGKIPALFAAMGLQSRAELQKLAIDGAKDLNALASSNEATTTELVAQWEKGMQAITAGEFPKLPVEWAKANALVLSRLQQAGIALTAEQSAIIAKMIASVEQGARTSTEAIVKGMENGRAALVSAGSNTTQQLVEQWVHIDKAAAVSFRNVAESGKTSFARVQSEGKIILSKVVEDATGAGVKAAGGFTTSIGAIGPAMEKLRNDVKTKVWDGLIADANKANTDLGKGLSFAGQSFSETLAKVNEAARLYGANFGAALDETTKKAAVDFGLISKSAAGMADGVQAGFEKAIVATNAFGNALAETLESTKKMHEGLKGAYKMDFADNIPALLEQLKRAQKEFANIAGQGDPLGAPGFRNFTMDALSKTIDAIKAKLKGLGMDMAEVSKNPFDKATAGAEKLSETISQATTRTDGLTASTDRLGTKTLAASSAAGSAAGNYARLGSDTAMIAGAVDALTHAQESNGNMLVELGSRLQAQTDLGNTALVAALETEIKGFDLKMGHGEELLALGRQLQTAQQEGNVEAEAALIRQMNLIDPTIQGVTMLSNAVTHLTGEYRKLAAASKLPAASDFAQGGRLKNVGDIKRMPGSGKGAQPMPPPPGPSLIGRPPSPGNPRPPGFNIPGRPLQRFAQGGIVGGTGGVDSQLILATPGERVSTPGQDRAISFSFGGDIVVNINGSNASSASPEALGDIAAQALVRALSPRLNESLRRGHGEKFA